MSISRTCYCHASSPTWCVSHGGRCTLIPCSHLGLQEKLNESITVMNKTLQVGPLKTTVSSRHWLTAPSGDQHPEHEHRARGPDVQELPVERVVPLRR